MFKKPNPDDEKFMRMAIGAARIGIENGQTPFGACIVREGEIFACEHNTVWASTDITAHAEVNAIRAACSVLQTVKLHDCTIYSTCEPCPMCFGAIHWAGISRIVFGATISDAAQAGFSELTISNKTLRRKGRSKMEIVSGIMHRQCGELFVQWEQMPQKRTY